NEKPRAPRRPRAPLGCKDPHVETTCGAPAKPAPPRRIRFPAVLRMSLRVWARARRYVNSDSRSLAIAPQRAETARAGDPPTLGMTAIRNKGKQEGFLVAPLLGMTTNTPQGPARAAGSE